MSMLNMSSNLKRITVSILCSAYAFCVGSPLRDSAGADLYSLFVSLILGMYGCSKFF